MKFRELTFPEKLYQDFVLLDRKAKINGEAEFYMIGLVKTIAGAANLLILEPNEQEEQEYLVPKSRPKTRRQQLLRKGPQLIAQRYQYPFSTCFPKTLQVDGKDFQILESLVKEIHEQEMFLLRYFLKMGWNPENLMKTPLEFLQLREIQLNGEWNKIAPQIQSSKEIAITMGWQNKRVPTKKRMTLQIKSSKEWVKEKRYVLPDNGQDFPFWIDRVSLYDPWENFRKKFSDWKLSENYTDEELSQAKFYSEECLKKMCPQGKYLPLIEYECEDGRQLDFYDGMYLKEPYEQQSNYFDIGVRLDKTTGVLGYPLRGALLQTPVDSDCTKVIAEVLFFWENLKKDITIKFFENRDKDDFLCF